MSVPPKLCGFDLLPLQEFHLMVSWVPPGITRQIDGVFERPGTLPSRIYATLIAFAQHAWAAFAAVPGPFPPVPGSRWLPMSSC
jgi:hypothetical protein